VLGGLIDLLAAVPSLVFGMWGLYFLIPNTKASRCGCPPTGVDPDLQERNRDHRRQYGKDLLIAGSSWRS